MSSGARAARRVGTQARVGAALGPGSDSYDVGCVFAGCVFGAGVCRACSVGAA